MTPEQISQVQESWKAVEGISETAADLFYNKLFEMDPSLSPLFQGDIKEQGAKLMKMIGVAVNGLSRLETIVPAVQQLGVRHAGYGVKDEHYDTVAGALLWTLGQGLGEAFTDDLKQAWTEAYTILATTMKEAAATTPA